VPGGFRPRALSGISYIVFALASLAFLGNTFPVFLLVVGVNSWEQFARMTRGLVLSAVEQDYIFAARSLGISSFRLYSYHVLPNIIVTLIVQASLSFSGTILLETALSFLGLGVRPSLTSLGQMLGEGRDYLLTAP
jgi:peptide/nickel transport system permease protein